MNVTRNKFGNIEFGPPDNNDKATLLMAIATVGLRGTPNDSRGRTEWASVEEAAMMYATEGVLPGELTERLALALRETTLAASDKESGLDVKARAANGLLALTLGNALDLSS